MSDVYRSALEADGAGFTNANVLEVAVGPPIHEVAQGSVWSVILCSIDGHAERPAATRETRGIR